MQLLYDLSVSKKATNLSSNSVLLIKYKALNINLSTTLEQALKDKPANTEAQKWSSENKNAIKAYNKFIEDNGCFGDELRSF